MVGSPLTETPAQNIDVAGVTVLGYDECQTVLVVICAVPSALHIVVPCSLRVHLSLANINVTAPSDP
jgi:hypothetical protein